MFKDFRRPYEKSVAYIRDGTNLKFEGITFRIISLVLFKNCVTLLQNIQKF